MEKLNCVLYVQDAHIESVFVNFINHFCRIKLTDTFTNLIEMVEKIHRHHPDILLIDMSREEECLQLIEMIDKPPFIIALMHNANSLRDYLNAGFFDGVSIHCNLDSFTRLMNKIFKIVNHYQPETNEQVKEPKVPYVSEKQYKGFRNFVFLKHKRTSTKVNLDDITFIQIIGNTLRVQCVDGSVCYHNSTLKEFLEKLPQDMFSRINQGVIANHKYIDRMDNQNVFIQGKQFKLSRRFSKNINAMKM